MHLFQMLLVVVVNIFGRAMEGYYQVGTVQHQAPLVLLVLPVLCDAVLWTPAPSLCSFMPRGGCHVVPCHRVVPFRL